jgi:hypothetical protein
MDTQAAEHCDDLIDDPAQPECLRRYLGWARLPAVCNYPARDEKWVSPELRPHIWRGPPPKLFADHQGKRVRVVMASRFGDVGITEKLNADFGYSARVPVSALSNFSDRP